MELEKAEPYGKDDGVKGDAEQEDLGKETYSEPDKVIDFRTGGMYGNATALRKTSFLLEGAKYHALEPPHRVMAIMSTPFSNRRSRIGDGKPF